MLQYLHKFNMCSCILFSKIHITCALSHTVIEVTEITDALLSSANIRKGSLGTTIASITSSIGGAGGTGIITF